MPDGSTPNNLLAAAHGAIEVPAPFADYADRAATCITEWCEWHAQRALARDLGGDDNTGLLAVAIAAHDLAFLIGDDADDDARDAASEALHAAITAAKDAAEDARLTKNPAACFQAEEVETSHLRSWARLLDTIDWCQRSAREQPGDSARWALEAATHWIFHAPPTLDRDLGQSWA